ncbi:hypothetical protein DB44_EC00330 [Candidatus Protochlamydia amoebophila]|uniref:DUF177 domain-containing protein n=2 Tax=Candidatus Protochlamydia amoebophila TaxID=362787 RepID=A0A0C1JVG1_9BACT|nr:hypothetical protein DB44_EC00330 [Candidatus Protochlamydia amoebophila]
MSSFISKGKVNMDDQFKIFVDQLRDGHEKIIHESLFPDFIDIHETDLSFKKNIELDGVAYKADDELILNWKIRAQALMSCSICNEAVPVNIEIDNFYHSEPLAEVKGAIYNFKDLLRETILIEVPAFAECEEGNCPRRQEVSKYLKEPSEDEQDIEDGYQPFANLDWKE